MEGGEATAVVAKKSAPTSEATMRQQVGILMILSGFYRDEKCSIMLSGLLSER